MDTQLNRQCLEVLHAKTVKDLVRISAEFGRSMGFHTVGAMVVTDHSPYLTEFQTVTNAAPDYLPTFEDADAAKLDPVSQYCKQFSSPLVWDQTTYVAAGRADFWEHQAAYGFQSGLCVAFHLPRGKHFMFGFASDKRKCCDNKAKLGLSLDVQEFAAHAQAAAFDLCTPDFSPKDPSTLSMSELDALSWSMDGLSNWDIGCAMGRSETEVLLRLRRAMTKLGCATKYEAALQAIRLGLVGRR